MEHFIGKEITHIAASSPADDTLGESDSNSDLDHDNSSHDKHERDSVKSNTVQLKDYKHQRAQAWNIIIKITKSYGRFIIRSVIPSADPVTAWTSIVSYYETPPPPLTYYEFFIKCISYSMKVMYLILICLCHIIAMLSNVLLFCLQILTQVLQWSKTILSTSSGPLYLALFIASFPLFSFFIFHL